MSEMLRLVEHDGEWASRFAAEASRIRGAIAAHVMAMEHVGSTAVPGLAGKPVPDVAVAVSSDQSADACVAPLEALGYEYRGAPSLRADRELAIAYAAEKQRVAAAVGWDKGAYSGENPFIQTVLRQLRERNELPRVS